MMLKGSAHRRPLPPHLLGAPQLRNDDLHARQRRRPRQVRVRRPEARCRPSVDLPHRQPLGRARLLVVAVLSEQVLRVHRHLHGDREEPPTDRAVVYPPHRILCARRYRQRVHKKLTHLTPSSVKVKVVAPRVDQPYCISEAGSVTSILRSRTKRLARRVSVVAAWLAASVAKASAVVLRQARHPGLSPCYCTYYGTLLLAGLDVLHSPLRDGSQLYLARYHTNLSSFT